MVTSFFLVQYMSNLVLDCIYILFERLKQKMKKVSPRVQRGSVQGSQAIFSMTDVFWLKTERYPV